jgi:hypothetical protein
VDKLQEELAELMSQLASTRTQSSLTASQESMKVRQLQNEIGTMGAPPASPMPPWQRLAGEEAIRGGWCTVLLPHFAVCCSTARPASAAAPAWEGRMLRTPEGALLSPVLRSPPRR